MERSFILFSFLFLIFPPYDLFVFLLANQSDLSESWQADGKGPWKSNQVKRWVKPVQTFKQTVVKKISSHLILPASEQTSQVK